MREFSVLIRSAPDVPGQWVAHCLNWDLVSQGDSPSHAFKMIVEATIIAIEDDSESELDPSDRPRAPDDLWELFARTQQRGARIAASDIDSVAKMNAVLAATMYLEKVEDHVPSWAKASVPPPFVIAEIQDASRGVHG